MPSNIKINDVKSLKFRCKYDEYYDFMLYRGECYGDGYFGNCLAADIDATDLELGQVKRNEPPEGEVASVRGGEVYSKTKWRDAINSDTVLKDIGLTGIDNGFISYKRDQVTNRDFINIYTNTTYEIPDGDLRFFMSPVSGNTGVYKYPMYVQDDNDGMGKYFAMRGGFLQGFYKLHEMDYQTLPHFIEDEWNMSFQIRPQEEGEAELGTLNRLHPENDGIFFYMGTRAENKFWDLYNHSEDKAEFLIPSFVNDGYLEELDWDMQEHSTNLLDYMELEPVPYMDDEIYAVDPEYWQRDIDLSEIDVLTSMGYQLDKHGYYEIETDNKFIFFNRTCTGFTVNNWYADENEYKYEACKNRITPTSENDYVVSLTGITSNCKENKFITYNRTCTGKTVNNVHKGCYHVTGKNGSGYFDYSMDEYEPYDVFKDIKNNSFALRVKKNENGEYAIGYKYGMLDCDCFKEGREIPCTDPDHNYNVKEEYSKYGIIKPGEWNTVHLRIKILNPTYKDCIKHDEYGNLTVTKVPTHIGERKMKIYIYVNGYLVFISQELAEFRFRALDDIYQKQEGVPFNISLGGGSQGLLETISKDYYHITEYMLPIEKYFAGTFYGDIRYFKFYDCFMDFPTIRKTMGYVYSF